MTITIQEAVNYIRSKDILQKWTDAEIYDEIARAIFNDTLIYSTDRNGTINGIAFGTDFKEEKRLHVKCLASSGGHLKQYINIFRQRYPGYIISAYRDGKFVTLKI